MGNQNGNGPAALRFSRALLAHRTAVICAFAIATVAAALCVPRVAVNYSMTDYLPQDTPSTRALDQMEETFGAGVPNVRLYARGIDLAAADGLADALSRTEGVDEVMWLGTQVDVKEPLEIADASAVQAWKTDDGFLFQLVVDERDGQDNVARVRAAARDAGADPALSGSLVSTVAMQQSASSEVRLILAAAVAIVVAILLVTSHSWFEPVVFLIPIGVAIVLNMGSNIFMGEISFVSQICGAVLQLAVSMDYAIVFLHRFRSMQRTFDDPVEAMAHCMQRSFTIELSSASVTFFGFLALTVMRFGIGVNLGIVLAKGIVFSFLSVIFLMPCLILLCLPVLDRFEHPYLVPSLDGFARGIQRVAAPVALAIALIAIPCYLGEGRTDFLYGPGDAVPADSEAGREDASVREAFGAAETWVVMVPEGRWAQEQALVRDLEAIDGIDGATSYVTVAGAAMPVEVVPADQLDQVISGGWSRIVLTTDVEGEGDEAFALVERVRDAAAGRYGDDYLLAGNAVSIYDLRDTVHQDSAPVKFFTVASIGIVLAIMFRSLSIPVLILAAIEVSIWINLAVPYFAGSSLSYIGYLVIDSVQTGAAVDYAIVLAREYFDRRRHEGPADASRDAVASAGVPIATSASILVLVGLMIRLISTNGIISQLGTLIFRGALISGVMMFLFLPYLFRLFDGLVRRTSWHLAVWRPGDGAGRSSTGEAPGRGDGAETARDCG